MSTSDSGIADREFDGINTVESNIPPDVRVGLIAEINSAAWRKTTTYPPHLEHEYILMRDNTGLVERLSDMIDVFGHDEPFYSKMYRYLVLDGYRYWHFESLVNRETMEQYYSRREKER